MTASVAAGGTSAPGLLSSHPELEGPHRHPWAVVAVTTLGSLLMFLNSSSVSVALPAISEAFDVSAAAADWVLLGYMLALTAGVLIFSRLGDMYGRRRLYIGGLVLMIGASLVASVSGDIATLVVLRSVQGVAAAAIIPNANAIISDAFPTDRLALGLSINIMMASAAMILGPVVGGWLLELSGWRTLFVVNVPFGLVAVLLAVVVLRRDARRPLPGERLDVVGAALAAAGLGALILGLNRLSAPGWTAGALALSVLGVALVAAFVHHVTHTTTPLIDVAVVRERARALAYATAFLMSFPQAGALLLVVLYQQIVRGTSAVDAGIAVSVLAAAIVVTSPLAGLLARACAPRAVSSVGCAMSAIGYLALLASMDGGSPGPTFYAGLVLIGAGNGIFTAPNTAAIMAGLPAWRRGIANGVRSVMFNSAQTMGTAVVLVVIYAGLASAGFHSYDVVAGAHADVLGGFRSACLVLTVFAIAATATSLARGGAWLVDTGRRPAPNPATNPDPEGAGA